MWAHCANHLQLPNIAHCTSDINHQKCVTVLFAFASIIWGNTSGRNIPQLSSLFSDLSLSSRNHWGNIPLSQNPTRGLYSWPLWERSTMWALVRGQVRVLEMFSLKNKKYPLGFIVSGSLNFDWRIFIRKGILFWHPWPLSVWSLSLYHIHASLSGGANQLLGEYSCLVSCKQKGIYPPQN